MFVQPLVKLCNVQVSQWTSFDVRKAVMASFWYFVEWIQSDKIVNHFELIFQGVSRAVLHWRLVYAGRSIKLLLHFCDAVCSFTDFANWMQGLFGPILCTMLLLSLFLISWARSSSTLCPSPPLQLTKKPHLNSSERRGVNMHSIWAMLTNISMAYSL